MNDPAPLKTYGPLILANEDPEKPSERMIADALERIRVEVEIEKAEKGDCK